MTKNLPCWMTQTETYVPNKDKDAFINKSILAMLNVLSRVHAQSRYADSKRKPNAAVKLLFVLLVILLTSVSGNFAFVMTVFVGVLLWLCVLKAELILDILKVVLVVTAFTLLILLPSVFMGNLYSIYMITPKVFISITLIGILSRTSKWDELTRALRVFFIPELFIFILDITVRYIYLLGELSLHMLYALKLRSVGKNSGKYASLSGIAGTIFLKSREMATDMHSAMQCRGFTGEYKSRQRLRLKAADTPYAAAAGLLILTFIVLGR